MNTRRYNGSECKVVIVLALVLKGVCNNTNTSSSKLGNSLDLG